MSASLAIAACRANPPVDGRDVTFAAADGATVHATIYTPKNSAPPAMLLLHMLGSDRRAWDPFAHEAVARGFLVLAIDLRGHGDAFADGALTPGSIDSNAVGATQDHDLGPAIDYLIDSGADPKNIVVIGASIGANIALGYAATDPRVQAVVLLSPGEDYRGITVLPALNTYTKRPLLILATEGDNYSAATARKMKSMAQNYCELRMYRGSSHGTDILDAVGLATGQIFLWLEPILGQGAPSAP